MAIERNFEQIVKDNAGWLYKFVRSFVKSDYAAEEITQKTFYLAYKGFSGYSEYGKERAWLKAIARNAVRKYYNKENKNFCVSLDSLDADDQYTYYNVLVSDELLPEEKVIRDELISDIMRLIAALPEQQKTVITYRYINDFSIAETSHITGLPEGTVKSSAYYGIKSIREQLGIAEKNKNNKKGVIAMEKCLDYYGLLFEYVKGYLTKDERAQIEKHIAGCSDCAKITKGLNAIWQYLQKEFNEDDNYFNVAFQIDEDSSLTYIGFSNILPQKYVDEINEMLAGNGNKVPEGQSISFGGHDADLKHLSEYTNEGGKVEFELIKNPQFKNNVRCIYKTIPKVYQKHWSYTVFYSTRQCIKKSKDSPKLYTGYYSNDLGKASKCGLFAYIYDGATNIRIKKGSGVLDFDGVKFAYSQRFTSEEERIDLSFTFNL